MTRRRIAMVSGLAMMAAAVGAISGPAAHAAPPPRPNAAAGPTAFTHDSFTVNPTGHTGTAAIANARKALAAHTGAAHAVRGQAFAPRTVVVDRSGAADVRFDRTYHNLPVYGGDVVVHLKPGGTYRTMATAATDTPGVSRTPKIPSRTAAATARKQVTGTVQNVGTPRLAVWNSGRSSRLVWETVVRGLRADRTPTVLHVLVDARSGAVVTRRDEISALLSPEQAARAARAPRHPLPTRTGARTYTAGSGTGIYDGKVSLDLTKSGGTWSMTDPSHGNGTTTDLAHATDGAGKVFQNSTGTFGDGKNDDAASAGVDAHYGAAKTFDYYKSVHGRSGIFGDGKGVPSRTHYGDSYVNAFWDGTQMTYGDGEGNARPLTEIDVAAHEMSHGVSGALTGWDETGETGGMNEGTSDIFGTLVEFYANSPNDKPDYTMGELIDIYGNGKPLRYMYQPSLDGQSPDCWDSGNGSLDPHYSLGPLTHWFFLLAQGSGDNGYGNSPTCDKSTITGLGNDKAGAIWYKALASYANSSEDYHQARTDSLKAASDLYGADSTEYKTVDAAWAAVGVTASNG